MATPTSKPSYFIAKVANIPALAKCIETGVWACKDRITPPQPRDLLSEAFTSRGPVIIVFSVNNCHGYHGYAEMMTVPATKADNETGIDTSGKDSRDICAERTEHQNITGSHNEKNKVRDCGSKNKSDSDTKTLEISQTGQTETWYYFDVKWKLSFLKEFGEQCLAFSETNDLYVDMDNGGPLPLNKCRNWQEMTENIGQKLCERLENCFSGLCAKRDAKLQRQLDKQAQAFYETGQEETTEQTWQRIIAQVEGELGKVILACPFGSQRYNVSTPESDTDMFLVYQAKTEQVLGFNAPKQTVKNSEREVCDYTIHEVHRFCELLASGDARCVETLFLHEATIVHRSLEWQKLVEGRRLLLNKDCLNKYLRDAQGSKGTRYLRKWCDDNKQAQVLPPKLCKMLYVIVRLLQNARDVATGCGIGVYRATGSEDRDQLMSIRAGGVTVATAWEIIQGDVATGCGIRVYRATGSEDRDQLMSIRAGGVTVATAWEIIQGLESEIAAKESSAPEKTEEATQFLERWLLDLRYKDFVETRLK